MSGNAKFRWFLVAPIIIAIFFIATISESVKFPDEYPMPDGEYGEAIRRAMEHDQAEVDRLWNEAMGVYKDQADLEDGRRQPEKGLGNELEGAQEKVPLAITEFVFKGGGSDARGMGKEARSILEKDLRLSGLFSPLRKPVFEELERMEQSGSEVDYRSWRQVGAQWVIKTEYEMISKGRRQVFTFRLYDAVNKRFMLGKRYKASPQLLRKVVHQFAGEVVSQLTGKRNITETQIASLAWRQSITDLSNQLIKNIPREGSPLLGVIPFKDLKNKRTTTFSRILSTDIKTILARADDLKLKEIESNADQQAGEIAKSNGLDYYVSGSYRMERGGLEIRARLIDTQTRNIMSSANILIERKDLILEDLALIDNMADEFKSTQKRKSYQEYLEKRQKPEEYRNRQEDAGLAEKNRQLEEEKRKLEEERKKLKALRLAEEKRQRKRQAQAEKKPPPHKEQKPQSGSGSGFFVSKMGHVITNAHVVKGCKKLTVGDNANKQVPAELINTDRSNDLALLKLSTLEMASAESKSLIQKLSIVVVPLASKGLLRSDDVKLGEKVLVAGFPFGEYFSNTIKVTGGLVSATRGSGDDSGQFQLDAAVQPGNSGGPIYDSSGNIVGVVVSQLDKRMVEKAIGSMPENVNFGIKASTVRQFLISSGVPSKKSEQTEEKSTQQLAEIAKNQALMVMCLQ